MCPLHESMYVQCMYSVCIHIFLIRLTNTHAYANKLTIEIVRPHSRRRRRLQILYFLILAIVFVFG